MLELPLKVYLHDSSKERPIEYPHCPSLEERHQMRIMLIKMLTAWDIRFETREHRLYRDMWE